MTGNPVIELQAGSEIIRVATAKAWHQEFQGASEKRSIGQHQFAFAQSALDDAILAEITFRNRLLQVSDAAMHKLGGSTGGCRDEVAGVQQNRSQAAKLRVERATRSCRPATDHADIKCRALDTRLLSRSGFSSGSPSSSQVVAKPRYPDKAKAAQEEATRMLDACRRPFLGGFSSLCRVTGTSLPSNRRWRKSGWRQDSESDSSY